MGCEIRVDRGRFEQVSEFKYLGYFLNYSGTDDAECRRKIAKRRKDEGTIKSLANARGLQLECARVLPEGLLVPVLLYGSETMIWIENERSRIRAVHMDNLRDLLGVRRIDRVPNSRIREL